MVFEKGKDAITLSVTGLYWGVRCMIERLTANADRVKTAEHYLEQWKCPGHN
jgi:hypothetical protein